MSSTRPKRNVRPPVRYEPEERPLDDDDYSDDEIDIEEARKKLKGEFDGFDDEEEEEEEDVNEPNEYDLADGFLVPDEEEVVAEPVVDDDEEFTAETSLDDDVDDDDDYDDDEDDDAEVSSSRPLAKVFEPDLV